jgi:hypothetical protein
VFIGSAEHSNLSHAIPLFKQKAWTILKIEINYVVSNIRANLGSPGDNFSLFDKRTAMNACITKKIKVEFFTINGLYFYTCNIMNWKYDNKSFLLNPLIVTLVFSAAFNNISVISWQSVLLMEETGRPGENHRPVACYWQTLSHNAVSSTPHLNGIWTYNVSGDWHWLHRLL